MTGAKKTRVLIVDDSAIVRKLLSEALAGEKDIEVAGTAPDPIIARDKIRSLAPDVLTLDIEMPRMDGLTFLEEVMQSRPMPVIVISSLGQAGCRAALDAIRLGAVEVLAKPGGPYSVGELKTDLGHKVRAAASARIRRVNGAHRSAAPSAAPGTRQAAPPPARAVPPRTPAAEPPSPPSPRAASQVIAIGASTGGTEAIAAIVEQLPPNLPGIVIAQHIPAGFSRAFADRLNTIAKIEVREAADGDALRPGLALVAPGNFHMLLRRVGASFQVQVKDGPRVCYQRPAVDVLFHSVAEAAGKDVVGVLLTGMGSDGAQGMLKLRQKGAHTIAQDEESCVVFGMPREAIRLGGAAQVAPLPHMAGAILAAVRRL